MRWKVREKPEVGSERWVRKFLLFPKKLKLRNRKIEEWRWLETCCIIQRHGFDVWYDREWCDEIG